METNRFSFLAAISVISCCSLATAQVRYVDDTATGANNGLTWCDAYVRLQDALAAPSITEIRVAQGVYRPDRTAANPGGSGDREATFALRNGRAIRGGYAGCGAANPDARDTALYPSVLSGDLAGNDVLLTSEASCTAAGGTWYASLCSKIDNNGENSFHVVSSTNNDFTATLDGFTVSHGNANGPGQGPVPDSDEQGAAVNVYFGSPTLLNCTFEHNRTDNHGAVNDHGGATITGCEFRYNFAIRWGGAMHNHDDIVSTLATCAFHDNATAGTDGGGGAILAQGTLRPTDCTFTNNHSATKGGAIYLHNSSFATLIGCQFTGNSAATNGGALYAGPGARPTLDQCSLLGNAADRGGAIYADSFSHPALTECTISANSANRGGGAYFSTSLPIVTNTVFDSNSAADSYGGGAYVAGASAEFAACSFVQNTAEAGGGVYANVTTVSFEDCDFIQNHSFFFGLGGGGIYSTGSTFADTFLELHNCTFRANTTAGEGAGVYNYFRSTATLTGCDFIGNVADRNGGGFQSYLSPAASLTSCRFIGNSAIYGGGTYFYRDNVSVVNCLFNGNVAASKGGGVIAAYNNIAVINCTLTGNSADSGGGVTTQIFDTDPDTGDVTFTNSIFWNNTDQSGAGLSAQIMPEFDAEPVVIHSLVSGWDGSLAGSDNFDLDPLFADPLGTDNTPGTEDDDLHLSSASPAINSGDNSAVPPELTEDLDGNVRIVDFVVDLGAYEAEGNCPNGTCNQGEGPCNCPADCGAPTATSETSCNDGQDDDCDTFTDCLDSDCDQDANCLPPPIPTVTHWGLTILSLLLATAATIIAAPALAAIGTYEGRQQLEPTT